MTRLERMLAKLISGEQITDWKCQSRLEEHLLACINKIGIASLNTPTSRLEELLQVLAVEMQDDVDYSEAYKLLAGLPIEIATSEEMDAVLIDENVGKIYKYVGETNETYINGNVYMIVEAGE